MRRPRDENHGDAEKNERYGWRFGRKPRANAAEEQRKNGEDERSEGHGDENSAQAWARLEVGCDVEKIEIRQKRGPIESRRRLLRSAVDYFFGEHGEEVPARIFCKVLSDRGPRHRDDHPPRIELHTIVIRAYGNDAMTIIRVSWADRKSVV